MPDPSDLNRAEGESGIDIDAMGASFASLTTIQIEKLSPEELAAFRIWYAAFDAEAWNRQFEADVKAGKLDLLAGC